MLKIPKRLAFETLFAAVLMLGSCTAASDKAHSFTLAEYDRLDDADTNARNAIERLDKLNERLEAVEDRLKMTEQSDDDG